ncbi:MAG: hypothetical protein ACOC4M_17725 [Promethearchaeia archaeon]
MEKETAKELISFKLRHFKGKFRASLKDGMRIIPMILLLKREEVFSKMRKWML